MTEVMCLLKLTLESRITPRALTCVLIVRDLLSIFSDDRFSDDLSCGEVTSLMSSVFEEFNCKLFCRNQDSNKFKHEMKLSRSGSKSLGLRE